MNKKYFITGISGTGKTTIANELNKKGLYSIDADYWEFGLCSWKNKETKQKAHFEYGIGREFLKNNAWYCDVEKLKKLMDVNNDVVVVGLLENQNEFLNLFDKIFLLKCSEKTFFERIDNRTTNSFGKDPSEKEHILNFYKDFEEDLINRGAIIINCEKSINNVVDEILKNII